VFLQTTEGEIKKLIFHFDLKIGSFDARGISNTFLWLQCGSLCQCKRARNVFLASITKRCILLKTMH